MDFVSIVPSERSRIVSTSLQHGSYSRTSSYVITQHEYAGAEGGYAELLEIENPPEGQAAVVIHIYGCWGDQSRSTFWEWDSMENARRAFGFICYPGLFSRQKGFIRKVDLSPGIAPWFYAD